MPAFKIFKRRWVISSDDFVFPELTEAFMRFTWWLVVVIVYSLQSETSCGETAPGKIRRLDAFIITCLVVNVIDILFALLLAWFSSRGTIFEDRPRRRIPLLIYLRLPLALFEVIWLITGTYWAFEGTAFWPWHTPCLEPVLITARVTVFLGWACVFIVTCGLWAVFDPMGSLSSTRADGDHAARGHFLRNRDIWRSRIRWAVCCCVGRDESATRAYEDVASLFSSFFSGYDLVISDICAGLLLIANREVQSMRVSRKSKTGSAQGIIAGAVGRAVDPGAQVAVPSWMNLRLAKRYMEFAMATYGWPYYLVDQGCPGLVSLCRQAKCCRCCGPGSAIKNDTCLCNTSAFRLATGLKDTELFYVSFSNKLYEVPFVAAVDHETEAVVLALRGSMSLADAITDFSLSGVSLQLTDEKMFVHKGMFKSAEYVLNELESKKILYDLFILYPTYSLVITGHSLGAGVACVLSLRLREQYPAVRCFAFSPPGCVVSRNNPKIHTEDFVCAVILGDDLVPRLSLQTMDQMKHDVLEVLQHCDRPKYDILVRGCYKLLCRPRPSIPRDGNAAEEAQDAAYGSESNGITTDWRQNNFSSSHPRPTDSQDPAGNLTAGIVVPGSDNSHQHLDNAIADKDRSMTQQRAVSPNQNIPGSLGPRSTTVPSASPSSGPPLNPDEPLIPGLAHQSLSSYHSIPAEASTTVSSSGEDNATAWFSGSEDSAFSHQSAISVTEQRLYKNVPLHCPGRIIHVKRRSSGAFYAEWGSYERFDDILITSKMLSDHMPYSLMNALREIRLLSL